MQPLVVLIIGSVSDWETLRHAAQMLDQLAVTHEVRVVSARRTPDLLFEYASTAEARGIEVIIAAADRGEDRSPRARRAGAVPGTQRSRFPALHRADAGRWARSPSAQETRSTRPCSPPASSATSIPRSARRLRRPGVACAADPASGHNDL